MATEYVFPAPLPREDPPPLSPALARRIGLLASSTLFQDLARDQLVAAAKPALVRIYRPNHLLFAQGQPAGHLFLLDCGSVKLTQHGADGTEVILNLCGAHDALGISALLTRNSYRSSARVMSRCKALVWDRPTLESLLASIPRLRANIDTILAERINELQDRLLDINTEDVERRVALALLRMLPHVGQKSPSGVEVPLSHEELAQLTGTNPFALSRIVARWNVQGLVETNPQAVLILDPKRLFTTGLA